MNADEIAIITFTATMIIFAIILILGLSQNIRRFVARKFNNWIDNKKRKKRLFRQHSNHIKKYDWLKFYSSIIGILLAVIVISGVLSHFGAVSKAEKVCYARLGEKDCNIKSSKYEYFIPGTRAGVFDFPYKLGIAYECKCDDDTKTITMNMIKKTKVKEPNDEIKPLIKRLGEWLIGPINNNT